MNLKRILEIADDLQNSGIDCYIIKETVHDMLLKKEADKVQLVVQFSLSKVEEYFKAHNYQIKVNEGDFLVAFIENTRFEVRTLKYITQNDFFNQIICTDFTANTLIMRSDENLLDMFGAIQSIQNRQLVPCENFDITRKNFDFAFYNDLINKIYVYGYKMPTDYAPYIFDYLSRYSDKLKPNAKKKIIESVLDYCVEHDTRDTNLVNFLSIRSFYKKISSETISPQGINKLIQLPRGIMLMTLLYLYGFTKEDYQGVNLFNAICDYAGSDLSDENNYDKAYTTYGFEVVNEVVIIQGIIAELEGRTYQPPKYHHKSVFSELEKLTWVEAPVMDDIGGFATTSFSDVSKTIKAPETTTTGYMSEIKSYANDLDEESEVPTTDFKSKIANAIKKETSKMETFDSTNAKSYFETPNPPNQSSPNSGKFPGAPPIKQNNFKQNGFSAIPPINNPILNNPDPSHSSGGVPKPEQCNTSEHAQQFSIPPVPTPPPIPPHQEPGSNEPKQSLNLKDALSMLDEEPEVIAKPTPVNDSQVVANPAENNTQNDFNKNLRNRFNTIVLNKQ